MIVIVSSIQQTSSKSLQFNRYPHQFISSREIQQISSSIYIGSTDVLINLYRSRFNSTDIRFNSTDILINLYNGNADGLNSSLRETVKFSGCSRQEPNRIGFSDPKVFKENLI